MIIVLMGVCGCGKSTIGKKLARLLDSAFIEGDDLHPVSNTEKMTAGIALTDDDRWPWLETIGQRAASLAATTDNVVISCSALKRSYRDRLRSSHNEMRFVYLAGSKPLLQTRMLERRQHFMPPGLLDSQLAILEPPGLDENPFTLDVADDPDKLASTIAEELFGTKKMARSL